MKKLVSNQLNHSESIENAYSNEKNDGHSLTTPQQSLSVRELLRRSGIVSVGRQLSYDDKPDLDRVDPLSRVDRDIISIEEEYQRLNNSAGIVAARQKAEAKPEPPSEEAKAEEQLGEGKG